ncbi:trans-sulfuration enzyme family protein [Paenibacillus nasutitermitis]|uniref:homocysteine desulfhydrase n=1 Tax=Paenibacillus nasutitermitis TaxID=1652958 RepID=A0A916YL78_9BACL|nr:aminotransferase class I/II-fold pyridoxal phosphate-dependent enzyme [Paenibacillus nasutitermitis]GGD50006.1 hypothetical protein GCM10010911_04430 [Paenibacillus nasutitermitis]
MSQTMGESTADKKEKKASEYTRVVYDPIDTRHYGAIHTPIYQNSLFAFENYDQFDKAFQDLSAIPVYSRGNNPTVRYLEQKIADLEEAEDAKCFSSGMAAITAAIMSTVSQGDHIICINQVYGPTKEFLGSYMLKFGVETTFVDGSKLEAWEDAVRPNTKLFYLESPSTQMFQLQDIRACAELAKSIGAVTVIDNTCATPLFQKPLQLGADLSVHSISKYIGGHSDCIGGVVIGSSNRIKSLFNKEYMLFGGIMTPQTAALVSKGIRTLPLRLRRHEASALRVAAFLQEQPFVSKVNHPGLDSHPQHKLALTQMSGSTSLFSFESVMPLARIKEWANGLKYFKIAVSWGGFESLVTVNEVAWDNNSGSRVVVRLYVGLEEPDDLIADIAAAWKHAEALEAL